MRNLNQILLLFVIAALVPLAAKDDVVAGKEVYAKRCVSCHGTAGEGKESVAKMLKVELRHLGSKEVQTRSDAELRKVITEGTAKKKPVKGLSEEELANLIAYLRTLAKK